MPLQKASTNSIPDKCPNQAVLCNGSNKIIRAHAPTANGIAITCPVTNPIAHTSGNKSNLTIGILITPNDVALSIVNDLGIYDRIPIKPSCNTQKIIVPINPATSSYALRT